MSLIYARIYQHNRILALIASGISICLTNKNLSCERMNICLQLTMFR